MSPATDVSSFAAGFIAAEGCFTTAGPRRFVFSVGLGALDGSVCHTLRDLFGVGHVHWFPRRKAHYDDEVTYAVTALPELINVIVPFMDEHLPPSHKRTQYLDWRTRLLDYWENQAKRVRTCSVEGCEAPRRAKGLCRRHYYNRYGQ